jgi:hypothetical protein
VKQHRSLGESRRASTTRSGVGLLPLALIAWDTGSAEAQHDSASRSARVPAVARPVLPEWPAPVPVDGMPLHRSLEWPVLAMRGETTYVVGNTLPVGESANHSLGVWGVVILRFPGAPIDPPRGDFVFKYPKAAIDTDGRLHLVWGEPADRVRASRELAGNSPTSLWYARYDRGRWSDPERIVEGDMLQWSDASSGPSVDPAGRVHVVTSAWLLTGRPAVVYARRSAGSWERHDIGGLATYAALAAWGRDSLAIAYTGPDPTVRGTQALLFVTSGNAGRTWSVPSTVIHAAPNTIFDVTLQHAGGQLHLFWRQGSVARGASQVLRYLRSGNLGRDWIPQPDAQLSAARHQLRFSAAANPCGSAVAIAESIGGTADSLTLFLDEIRWMRGSVTTRPLFPQFALAGSPGVVADQRAFRVVFKALVDPSTSTIPTLAAVTTACGDRSRRGRDAPK